MMDQAQIKVGIVSCSGEGLPVGTVSRFACRKVLDELRPEKTVTICLPLFIAGGEEERKFAVKFSTITVDGCEKRCAQQSTEKLSGKPAKSFVVSEILKEKQINPPARLRNLTQHEMAIVQVIAEEITKEVDEILER